MISVCPRKPLIRQKPEFTNRNIGKPRRPGDTPPTPGSIYENDFGQFCCDLCTYKSPSKGLVAKHRKTHFSYRPYGCSYCTFQAFARTRIEGHHRKVHGSKPFKIQIFEKPAQMTLSILDKRLDRSLFTKESLNGKNKRPLNSSNALPVKRIETRPKLKCKQCHYLFDNAESLESHMRVHQNQPCKCSHCGVVMRDIAIMKCHLEECHIGESPVYVNLTTGKTVNTAEADQIINENAIKEGKTLGTQIH